MTTGCEKPLYLLLNLQIAYLTGFVGCLNLKLLELFYLRVAHNLALNHVDHVLSDVGGMISNAFQVA